MGKRDKQKTNTVRNADRPNGKKWKKIWKGTPPIEQSREDSKRAVQVRKTKKVPPYERTRGSRKIRKGREEEEL